MTADPGPRPDRRLLRRVARVKVVDGQPVLEDGEPIPESGQFEVSTRLPDGSDGDYKMSVDAEWVIVDDGESAISICLDDHPDAGLVAIPLEVVETTESVTFELDGHPRPSHGGVFYIDADGKHIRRKLKQSFRRKLAKNAQWVKYPSGFDPATNPPT